jgi:DTW domain-containing protein YfiP
MTCIECGASVYEDANIMFINHDTHCVFYIERCDTCMERVQYCMCDTSMEDM